jgi:hypothetical protein
VLMQRAESVERDQRRLNRASNDGILLGQLQPIFH